MDPGRLHHELLRALLETCSVPEPAGPERSQGVQV